MITGILKAEFAVGSRWYNWIADEVSEVLSHHPDCIVMRRVDSLGLGHHSPFSVYWGVVPLTDGRFVKVRSLRRAVVTLEV